MAKTPTLASKDEATIQEVLQVTLLLMRRLRAETSNDDLTWSQMVVLGQLGRNGAMTTADLARAESVKPQSMGATLAVLEHEGLVERRPHPSDGRQVLFALTKAGLSLRDKRSRIKRAWVAEALTKLSPEELGAIAAAIEPLRKFANS
jgi:DNA-binding MarR family transcriptional regulator